MEKTSDILTENQINLIWGNANFGNDKSIEDKHKLIAKGLLQCVSGFSTGYTIQQILEELGLVLQTRELSQRGKRYLYAAYGINEPSI